MEFSPFIIYFQIETLPPYKHRSFIIYTQRVTNIERELLVVLWCEWLLPDGGLIPRAKQLKRKVFRSVRKAKFPLRQTSFVKGQTSVYKLPEQLDKLQIPLANLCWSVKSLDKDFCTDFFGVGINQKIEVGRTVNCNKHHVWLQAFRNYRVNWG